MKKRIWIILVVLSAFMLSAATPLPHNLTLTEKAYLQNHFDEYLRSKIQTTRLSSKPTGEFYAPAEFDAAEGVFFSWKGYTNFLKQLIKFIAEDYQVYVAVSSYSQSSAKSTLENYGVNMNNVHFINANLDSIWMRDFGPDWIFTKDGDRQVIDLVYNRPRPNDDKFPSLMAQQLGLKAFKSSLILPGGNLILDGYGVAIMTDVVFDSSQGGDPNMSMDQLKQYMKDYFNVKKVIMIKKMNNDGTGHADMFCKLLNRNTIIVGEYAKPEDGAPGNYAILNENAEKLAKETNGLGEHFKVVRIPMPPYSGGSYWGSGISYTYTNSLIINKKVLVPIYGFSTDEKALNIYRSILPGYDVRGFDSNDIISANGSIHCISKLLMADPLDIKFNPITTGSAGVKINITAKIKAIHKLDPDNVDVYYSKSKYGPFDRVKMINTGDEYSAYIPPQTSGSKIYYYIEAEDNTGMYENVPENAPENGVYTLSIN